MSIWNSHSSIREIRMSDSGKGELGTIFHFYALAREEDKELGGGEGRAKPYDTWRVGDSERELSVILPEKNQGTGGSVAEWNQKHDE